MKIGVGLPATIPNAPGNLVVEWAKKAESLEFSSLGIIDRIVYPNLESLITLAAAAAVTNRIRLMTTILLAPVRETVLIAKQAATLDRISGGRLTLGLGIGGRKDDSEATGYRFETRGKRFEEQLRLMKKIWTGAALGERIGAVGPSPVQAGGPEILIGGHDPRAISRIGFWGDGYMSGSQEPESASVIFRQVENSWSVNKRKGKPRLVCSFYFALGDRSKELGEAYLKSYYQYDGTYAQRAAKSLLSDPESIRKRISAIDKIGADELIIWPCVPDIGQLDLLSQTISSS
ncbi:MAG: LLM class flavin-dependent oxidoreductase [Rhabdochlamydiaceae bacterium]